MLCFVIFIFFNCHISTNATEESVPITVQQMSDRVIVLRVGDKAPFGDIIVNNVVAVNTQRGILLIDTGYYPQSAKTMRNLIQELFGRDDFAYVINTHWHWDHINGNQAFADVPIIGHKNIITAIHIFEQGLDFFINQDRVESTHGRKFFNRLSRARNRQRVPGVGLMRMSISFRSTGKDLLSFIPQLRSTTD